MSTPRIGSRLQNFWIFKIPLVIVLAILVSAFVYWMISATIQQWDRTISAGALAVLILEEKEGQSFVEASCVAGKEGIRLVLENGESFDFAEWVRHWQMTDSPEAAELRQRFRALSLSDLSVPTRHCRRWPDIQERRQQWELYFQTP